MFTIDVVTLSSFITNDLPQKNMVHNLSMSRRPFLPHPFITARVPSAGCGEGLGVFASWEYYVSASSGGSQNSDTSVLLPTSYLKLPQQVSSGILAQHLSKYSDQRGDMCYIRHTTITIRNPGEGKGVYNFGYKLGRYARSDCLSLNTCTNG